MEADSLNCAILGEDITEQSAEFHLFCNEVVREMSQMLVQEKERAFWQRPAVFGFASVVVLSLAALWWWGGSGEEPAP